MKIRDLAIGVRLGAGLTAVVALAICLFAVTLAQTSNSRAATVDALGSVLQRNAAVSQAMEALLDAAVSMRNVGLLTKVTDTQREEAEIKATRKRLAAMLQTMAVQARDGEAKAIVEALQQNERKLDAPVAEALAQAMALNPEGAVKVIGTKIEPLYRDSRSKMKALKQIEERRAAGIAEDSALAASHVLRMLLGTGLATVLAVVALGVLLTRSITVPIRRAVAIAQQVARGDLSATIVVDRSDETGELLESLRAMSEQLKGIVGEVLESADSIATATAEVSAGNMDLSVRTEEAASVSHQTVSAIDELGQTVRLNAGHARDASGLADAAAGVAKQGGDVVAEVVATMARISQASRKIADIISLIDGIAFQTNILALNAAVEAARAGEQGRGFAVVASEVRSLAQRSATAAREIKQLIVASVESVESGSALVERAGTTMADIVASVQGFNDVIRSVSSASDAQSQGIDQVRGSMARIDDATQRNAALVEEAAAASSSLQAQATRLRLSMSAFRV